MMSMVLKLITNKTTYRQLSMSPSVCIMSIITISIITACNTSLGCLFIEDSVPAVTGQISY